MILKLSLVQACTFRYYIVCHTTILFLVFPIYMTTGGELTPKRVFTTLAMVDAIFLSFLFSELTLLGLFQGGVAISRITVSMGCFRVVCMLTWGPVLSILTAVFLLIEVLWLVVLDGTYFCYLADFFGGVSMSRTGHMCCRVKYVLHWQ